MKKKTSSHRHQHFVAAFAVSAFALLGLLSVQQQQANATTASVLHHAAVMTTYRNSAINCIALKGKHVAQNNYHFCQTTK